MKDIYLQRKDYVEKPDISIEINGYKFKSPFLYLADNKLWNVSSLEDKLFMISRKTKKYVSAFLRDYEVKPYIIFDSEYKTDFIYIESLSFYKTKEAISLIKKTMKNCFVIVGTAFSEEDIDNFSEADGIVIGREKYNPFSVTENNYQVMKKLFDKANQMDKLVISGFLSRDLNDMIKQFVLGADLIKYKNPFDLNVDTGYLKDIMKMAGAKDLKEFSQIKYYEV